MEKIISKIKKVRKKFNSKKGNVFVKKYFKEKRDKNIKFQKNIWKKNDYWDYFFQSGPDNIKSSKYVPLDYYNYKVLPNLNDSVTKVYVQDKNIFDRVFGNIGVKLPKTIFRCMNNIFLDMNYNEIENIDEYVTSIEQDFILKKARQSGGGYGIEKFIYSKGVLKNIENDKMFKVHDYKSRFNGDFIVQEVIKQHSDLGKFHPLSVNTIKIMTYRSVETNKVHVLMAEIRIGANKSFIDNTSQGGLAVGIEIDSNNNGKLREYGFFEIDDYCTDHPNTKLEFKNSKIHNFHLVVDGVKKLANVVPYQRLIGWDFSINQNGEPVFIESNYGSGIDVLQLVNGKPIFGEFTSEVKNFLDKK